MKRLVLASCAAVLVLAPVLAFAQNRPSGGGSTVGSAAPRGESGGSSSSSSSSGSSGSSGGNVGSSGSSSMGGSFNSPVGGGGVGSSIRSYDGPRSGEATAAARPRSASASVGQPVPVSERARGDRPVYGQAVPRGTVTPQQNNIVVPGGYYPNYWDGFNPYFGSYGWYGSYGYYGSPYSYWGYPPLYGWGMYGLPMSAYSSYWYDYAGGASYTTSATGSIKLKVKPKDAEVYIDGTYYGQVDNYDGAFQHLDLASGTHKVEIRANGYQTLQLEMRVLPGKTITYTGELKPIK